MGWLRYILLLYLIIFTTYQAFAEPMSDNLINVKVASESNSHSFQLSNVEYKTRIITTRYIIHSKNQRDSFFPYRTYKTNGTNNTNKISKTNTLKI